MRELHTSRILATTALATVFILPMAANAQERVRQRLTTERVLDTIEVNAQKRDENLQDVPIAITAFDEAALEKFGISGLEDVSAFTPGLIASPNPGESSGLRLSIRGVGIDDPQIGLDTTVAVYVNGIYIGKSPGLVFDSPDLESITVAKGPQGTLFGRNAVGGAVSITTKGAELGEFNGSASLEAGNFGAFGFKGALNIPIGNTAAVKVAGLSFDRDGFVENVSTFTDLGGFLLEQGAGTDFGGTDRTSFTVDFAWEPISGLRFEYGYEDVVVDSEPFFNQAIPNPDPDAPAFGFLQAPTLGGPTPPLVPITEGFQREAVSTVPIEEATTTIQAHRVAIEWEWNENHSTSFLFGFREADSQAFASFFPEINPFVLTGAGGVPGVLTAPSPDLGGLSFLEAVAALPDPLAAVGVTPRADFAEPFSGDFAAPFDGPFVSLGTSEIGGIPTLDDHEQFSFELTQTGTFGSRVSYTAGLFYFDEDTAAGPFADRAGDALSLAQLLPGLGPAGQAAGVLAAAPDPFAGAAALATAPLLEVDADGALVIDPTTFAPVPVVDPVTGEVVLIVDALAGVLSVARAPGSLIEIQTEAFAAYGEVKFQITDQISITGGLRYSRDEREGLQQGFSPFFGDTTDLLGDPIPELTGDEVFDSLDPRVVIEYTPSDNILVYASYSQAFRSGGFNQAAVSFDDFGFEEERNRSVEFGFKSDLFNNRVRLNATAFFSFLDDQQFTFINPDQPITRFIDNNDGRVFGFELDGQFIISEYLTASFSYAFLDTAVDDFFSPFTGELVGEIDNAPRNSYTFDVDYTRPIGPGEISARLGFSHKDATTVVGVPRTDSDLLDARLSYTLYGEGDIRISVFAFGRNLVDNEFTVDALDAFAPLISATQVFGLPRTYGGGLTFAF